MKRQILFLSIITFFALSALAQTPYDNFAPEQSVKTMIEMPETKFKVSYASLLISMSSTPCFCKFTHFLVIKLYHLGFI